MPLQSPIFLYLGHLIAHPAWAQKAREDFRRRPIVCLKTELAPAASRVCVLYILVIQTS